MIPSDIKLPLCPRPLGQSVGYTLTAVVIRPHTRVRTHNPRLYYRNTGIRSGPEICLSPHYWFLLLVVLVTDRRNLIMIITSQQSAQSPRASDRMNVF